MKFVAAGIVIVFASGVIYVYAKFCAENIIDYFKYKNAEK